MFKTIKTILKLKGLKKTLVSDGKFIKGLRIALEEHIKTNPAEQKNILYYEERNRFAARLKFAPALSIALVFVVLSSAGAAVASQNSLPGNPLYPIKLITENIRVKATMNPRTKVELQIQFASERISEIQKIAGQKKMAEVKKDVDAALLNFQDNLDEAAKIVEEEKSKGKDVGNMAGVLSRKIDINAENLHQIFKEQKQELKSREEKMKLELETAQKAQDAAAFQNLADRLNEIKEQKFLLDDKKQTLKNFIDNKEEMIQNELWDKDRAENILNYVKREKQEIVDEAADKNVVINPERLTIIDKLMNEAKISFGSGNYGEAEKLAQQAKDELKKLEEFIKKAENELKEDNENNSGRNEGESKDENEGDIIRKGEDRSGSNEGDD